MNNFEYKLVRSLAPVYTAGIVLAAYAILFPFHRWYHFLIGAAFSLTGGFVCSLLVPVKRVKTARFHLAPKSSDAETNRLLQSAYGTLGEIEGVEGRVAMLDSPLAETVGRLVTSGHRILDYLSGNPSKTPLLRRFFIYYMPTLKKLLDTYLMFGEKAADTAEAESSRSEIREAVGEMEKVFAKQLDKLYYDAALDISTDISVLDAMLESDGLKNNISGAGSAGANQGSISNVGNDLYGTGIGGTNQNSASENGGTNQNGTSSGGTNLNGTGTAGGGIHHDAR